MTTLNVPAWVSPKEAERALEDARAMRSPLLMAERFSNGQWKRARHLAVVDFEFRNLLSDPNLDCLIIKMPVRHGKLLADETPIWTPDGWKTHGDLAVGSKVFAADGMISTVIGISEKQEADCEVVFSDGEVIKCHEAHEWMVWDRKKRRWRTIETKELFDGVFHSHEKGVPRARYSIPFGGVCGGHSDPLPVDPYWLGVWLGDGRSSSWDFCGSKEDSEYILGLLESRGMVRSWSTVHKTTGVHYFAFSGLPALKSLGLKNNKHIPDEYLTANQSVRLDVLRGLVDTDGHVEDDGRVRIVATCKQLVDDIETLVRSFGWRASTTFQEPAMSSSGIQGRKRVYTVQFMPRGLIVANLPRKQKGRKANLYKNGKSLTIREVRRVAPSPGHCIEIDHPSHLYLCGKTNKPTHNSEYLARWAPAWYLLRNPYRRVMICTNTSTLASSHSRWVRDKVHELGPMMGVPGVDPKHSSVKHWQIERAKGGCYAAGVGGSIVGFGADLLVIDDYLKDAKSSFSQKVRDDQWDWFVSTSGTRLEPGGKCVLLCTQWNSDDLIGRIEKRKDELDIRVRSITLQALREGTEVKDPLGRAEGEALWPERWPAEVMERRKRQAGHWWHSIYQGNPKGSSMSNWPESYFSNIFADDVDFPEPTDCLISASFLDPSKGKNSRKGDYQAQIWIGYKSGLFYVDSDIERKPIPKMVRDFVLFNRERKTAFVGLEANAWQDLLADDYWEVCQDIEYNADKPILVNQTTNKTVRIERLGKWLNQRLLRFRKSASNELLIKQMQEFPYGQHDDGPDALEACMALLCRSVDALHGLHEVTETEA
jgi:phage terminase large subunit-like protein